MSSFQYYEKQCEFCNNEQYPQNRHASSFQHGQPNTSESTSSSFSTNTPNQSPSCGHPSTSRTVESDKPMGLSSPLRTTTPSKRPHPNTLYSSSEQIDYSSAQSPEKVKLRDPAPSRSSYEKCQLRQCMCSRPT
ncbi:hypothetical protein BJ508DRAFT_414055 [Ascobolus immersus RN42]|uniref:Uncharacterized protein n=1 Tax=Ascobolus immersus RN42 TaxID=1160509 RepID=A0A3N4I999_ASCIM|nr:hypothetical protein BJ508DRAFT_414055 [Ascobolus immersus RN42]